MALFAEAVALVMPSGLLGDAVLPGHGCDACFAATLLLIGFLFFGRRERKTDYAMTPEEAHKTVRAGRNQVRQMRHLAIRIPEREMRQEIVALADIAGLILDALERDPAKIRRARRFLDYYLGTAVSLIQRYAQLGEHRSANAEIEAAMARFGDLIHALRTTFEEQHTLLLRDEAFEFQVDADVMQKIMDLDGL